MSTTPCAQDREEAHHPPRRPLRNFFEGPDGGLYFSPGDGNIIAIEEAGNQHDGVWDLDNIPILPPVKHILPA